MLAEEGGPVSFRDGATEKLPMFQYLCTYRCTEWTQSLKKKRTTGSLEGKVVVRTKAGISRRERDGFHHNPAHTRVTLSTHTNRHTEIAPPPLKGYTYQSMLRKCTLYKGPVSALICKAWTTEPLSFLQLGPCPRLRGTFFSQYPAFNSAPLCVTMSNSLSYPDICL